MGTNGTLALVAGERRLVSDDGGVTRASGAPERLERLERVPAPGGGRVFGFAGSSVYRLDEPAGEGRRVAVAPGAIADVSTWPGLLGIHTTGGHVLWLDLDGQPAAAPVLPLVPTRVAFLDERRGLARFAAAGLAYSGDGGATWQLVDAPPLQPFDARGDELRLGDHAVDGAGRIVPRLPRSEPLLLRWLARSPWPPVEAAVRAGVPLGPDTALVGLGGEIVAVHLSSGELAPWAELPAPGADEGARDPGPWSAVAVPGKQEDTVFFGASPLGVRPLLELDLGARARRPVVRLPRAGLFGGVVASSSGGLLVPGPCEEEELFAAPVDRSPSCVRQPSGRFVTVWSDTDPVGRGPTAAGGLVAWSGGEGPTSLVVVEPDGRAAAVARSPCERDELCHGVAPIDEVAPGEHAALLQVLRADGGGAMMLRHRRGEVKLERLAAPFAPAGYAQGRGAVEDDGVLRVTADAGRTWSSLRAPAQRGKELHVGALGLVWGQLLRVGWGEPAGDAPALPEVGFEPPTVAVPRPPTALALGCSLGAEARALPLWADEAASAGALDPAPPRGPGSALVAGLGAHARVELRPGSGSGAGARALVLTWVDQTELGAKVRTATGPAPPGLGAVALAQVSARGDQALFVLRSGGWTHWGRARGATLELAAPSELASPTDVAFAPDGSLAWVGADGVGHWPAKGSPRVVARVRAGRLAVGPPTKSGVPLLVGDRRWASFRVVAAPAARGAPGGAAPWLDVAGWRRAPFGLAELDALPACGPRATAHRFVLPAPASVSVGSASSAGSALVAVRADAASACLEGVTARIGADGFARIDVPRRRGEGALRGAARALSCKRA